ncbi:TonB-dependent receptor [Microbulbifer agarilyticus]|uniref:TonB-dependent receptor n=1 Tax=Microbulbifer agarilyticus TaxID=260552 RepID=UPI001CD5C334|nr:TonB-dependent receptor [Microbulbifer agarilyticus]MCA0901494.1 TonB-dependent receptor [Microbulbifer agarilyticus]
MKRYFASISCFLLANFAAPVVAQENQPEAEVGIEHITVTATKREENIQEVPISISAFDKDFFKDSGETNFNALEQYTPSLKIQSGPDTRTTSLRIRGIGSAGSNAGIDPSVGVFIDGVYHSRAGMNINDLVDIERVEVLRGPQGTLYGKNTAAGAINIITSKPTADFAAEGDLVFASNNRKEMRSMVNLPLGDTGNAMRMSAFAIKGDHLYKNTFNGEGVNNADKWGVKTRFLFNFEDSELLLNADYSKENTDCCALAVIDYNGVAPIMIGTPMTNNPSAMLPGLPYNALESAPGSIGAPPQADPFGDDYWFNDALKNDVEVGGLSAEWTYDGAESHSVTFINAVRTYSSNSSYDGDFTAYDAASAAVTEEDLKQYSTELRVASLGDNTVDYQVGLYGYYANFETEGSLGLNETVLLNSPQLQAGMPPLSAILGSRSQNIDINEYSTSALAVFGQLEWNLSDQLSATLGVRVTQETKERTGAQRTLRTPLPGLPPESLPPFQYLPFDLAPIAGADVDFDQKRSDSDISPSFNLRYFINDDVMAYASVSKGFKSGGFDQRRVPVQVFGRINGGNDSAGEFDEEEATSYELGWKSVLLNNRLTFNGTLYLVDYDNFQAQAFDGASTTVTNAGSLESYGSEMDILFAASENLTLGTAIGYNKAEYKEFDNGQCTAMDSLFWSLANPTLPCVADLAGKPLDNAPEWTYSSYAQYERPLASDLLMIARIEHNFVDSHYLDQDLDRNLFNESVELVNLRLTLGNLDRSWEVAAWGKNLLDEEYFLMGIDIPTVGGYAGFAAPRSSYGVTVRRSFN